jgi:hypothetical protein
MKTHQKAAVASLWLLAVLIVLVSLETAYMWYRTSR